MAGLSAHEIFIGLTTGSGPGSLTDAYDAAKFEADLEVDRADRINQLATKISAGWEGTAGTAAAGAARPLAVVSSVGAVNLEQTHRLLEQQTYSFDAARTNVRPVSEKPPETGIIDDLSPWDTDTEDEAKKHQADSDHNIRVYGQYDQQSWDNETALPMDYSTLQDPGGEIVIRKPEEPQPHPREPGPGGDDTTTPPGGDDRRTPPTPPPGEDTTKPQWQDPTTPQTHDPRIPPQTPPGRPPVPPPVTPPGLPPLTPPGIPPYGPRGRGGQTQGRGPGGGAGTGRGPGGAGTGRGPGGIGRGPGGVGPRPGGYGPGGPGAIGANEPGARAGAGAHDPHAQGRGGASGGQGRGGMGGGMGAGGRGPGGEDEEHTRASFLQEDDPEAIFGTDQVTAPPVIGE